MIPPPPHFHNMTDSAYPPKSKNKRKFDTTIQYRVSSTYKPAFSLRPRANTLRTHLLISGVNSVNSILLHPNHPRRASTSRGRASSKPICISPPSTYPKWRPTSLLMRAATALYRGPGPHVKREGPTFSWGGGAGLVFLSPFFEVYTALQI